MRPARLNPAEPYPNWHMQQGLDRLVLPDFGIGEIRPVLPRFILSANCDTLIVVSE